MATKNQNDMRSGSEASSRTFLRFFNDSHYPMFSRICGLLPIDAIIALTRTCKALSQVYQALQSTQWNVDRQLGPFFKDARLFRSQLARCDALVAGNFVAQFFERVKRDSLPSMKIFVEQGSNADTFLTYLSESEGYNLVLPTTKDFYREDVKEICTYSKQASGKSVTLLVEVTHTVPITVFLKSCNANTMTMNFLSWNKAYSLFPWSAFVRHSGYPAAQDGFCRYGQRPRKVVEHPEEESSDKSYGPMRRIADKFSWIITFDTNQVDRSETPEFVLEHGIFFVQKLPRNGSSHDSYDIWTETKTASILKHGYACLDISTDDDRISWESFLSERLDRLTPIELTKLRPSDRPRNYKRLIQKCDHNRVHIDRIERPDTWTYWDEEIPKWFQIWEQLHSVTGLETELIKTQLESK